MTNIEELKIHVSHLHALLDDPQGLSTWHEAVQDELKWIVDFYEAHDVEVDFVGVNARPRLTCMSKGCEGDTLVCQPYMDQAQWDEAVAAFKKKHPFTTAKDLGWRG